MKTPKKLLASVLIVFTGAVFFHCSSPAEIAGGSSSTEVSVVMGTVKFSDSTPAANVLVKIRPSNYLTDSLTSDSYRSTHSFEDTITDINGFFSFDSMLPDSYYVEISAQETLAVLVRTRVDSNVVVNLQDNFLEPTTEITGHLEFDSSTDSSRAIVQVYGMERHIYSDSTGTFKLRVPKGIHTLRFTDERMMPFPPDSMKFIDLRLDVYSGEYRDIGTLKLPPPYHHYKPPYDCKDGNCDSLQHYLNDSH